MAVTYAVAPQCPGYKDQTFKHNIESPLGFIFSLSLNLSLSYFCLFFFFFCLELFSLSLSPNELPFICQESAQVPSPIGSLPWSPRWKKSWEAGEWRQGLIPLTSLCGHPCLALTLNCQSLFLLCWSSGHYSSLLGSLPIPSVILLNVSTAAASPGFLHSPYELPASHPHPCKHSLCNKLSWNYPNMSVPLVSYQDPVWSTNILQLESYSLLLPFHHLHFWLIFHWPWFVTL